MAGYQGTEKVLFEICRTVMYIKRKACVIGEKDEFHAVKYNKYGWIGVLYLWLSIEWYRM